MLLYSSDYDIIGQDQIYQSRDWSFCPVISQSRVVDLYSCLPDTGSPAPERTSLFAYNAHIGDCVLFACKSPHDLRTTHLDTGYTLYKHFGNSHDDAWEQLYSKLTNKLI